METIETTATEKAGNNVDSISGVREKINIAMRETEKVHHG